MSSDTVRVKKRSLFLLITYSVLIVALMVRIGYYQIVKGEEYSKLAYQSQTRNRIINPKRGTIYDRNGKELAISASVETISVNTQDFKDKTKDTPERVDEIASDRGKILDMDPQVVRDRLMANTGWAFIKRKVDKEIDRWFVNISWRITLTIFSLMKTQRYFQTVHWPPMSLVLQG